MGFGRSKGSIRRFEHVDAGTTGRAGRLRSSTSTSAWACGGRGDEEAERSVYLPLDRTRVLRLVPRHLHVVDGVEPLLEVLGMTKTKRCACGFPARPFQAWMRHFPKCSWVRAMMTRAWRSWG